MVLDLPGLSAATTQYILGRLFFRREVDTIIRTVLVTEVLNTATNVKSEIYGRYDPVTLDRQGYKILNSFRRQYEISDALVAKYGTIKKVFNDKED